jgi:hypothetical protein
MLGVDEPQAPMSWMQRLRRVFAIDIQSYTECGGRLRVIVCLENPPLIAKILGHVRRLEALAIRAARTPPDSPGVLNVT